MSDIEAQVRAAFEALLRDDDPTGQLPFAKTDGPYPFPSIDEQFRWFLRGWVARERKERDGS